MKELLKKLLALFKTPAPNKPVVIKLPDFPLEAPAKKKPGRPKKVAAKGVVAAKKTAAKKTAKKAK